MYMWKTFACCVDVVQHNFYYCMQIEFNFKLTLARTNYIAHQESLTSSILFIIGGSGRMLQLKGQKSIYLILFEIKF